MAKRDSDTDLRKLLPDLETILKHADPAYSDQIYREAMDNPELDAAVAERDRALAEMDAREGTDKRAPANDAAASRVSAPSPWAKAGSGDAIDKSALPSASAPRAEAPAAAPPVTSPVRPAPMDKAPPAGRRALPRWVFPGIAAIALAPLAMWAVVSALPPRNVTTPSASAVVSAQATVPGMSEFGLAPGVQSSATPSAPPTTSAAAPPVTSAPTVTGPPIKQRVELRPRGALGVLIADAGAPELPKTSAPVAPVPPPPASSTPVAPPATSSFDPFLDKKPPR